MKTTKQFKEILADAAKYKEEHILTRKQRIYLEALVRAELKALRRAEKRAIKDEAETYMEIRHVERLLIYERLYGETL